MIPKVPLVVAGLFAAIFLAACQQKQVDSERAVESVAPSDPAIVIQHPATPGVDFEVVPGSIKQCHGAESVIAEVSWSIGDSNVNEVKVEAKSPQEQSRSLLSVGGRQGEVETEAWVVVGTEFFLSDSSTERELARFVVQGLPCD